MAAMVRGATKATVSFAAGVAVGRASMAACVGATGRFSGLRTAVTATGATQTATAQLQQRAVATTARAMTTKAVGALRCQPRTTLAAPHTPWHEQQRRQSQHTLTAQAVLRHMSTDAKKEPGKEQDKDDDDDSKLTPTERFKAMWKKYGYVAVGTYAAVYITTISSIAALISMGVDVKGAAVAVGLDRLFDVSSLNPKAGTLVLAFIATKFTSPIRIPVVLVMTPWVARMIQRIRYRVD